jgi:hypothetical protein
MSRNYRATSRVYAPRAADIRRDDEVSRGLRLHITDRFCLIVGDPRFEDDQAEDFGTLAEQAEAMRKLATEAGDIAVALEWRLADTAAAATGPSDDFVADPHHDPDAAWAAGDDYARGEPS